jgi:hypothetical protein
MISWLTWPVEWLTRRLSKRRVLKIQEALGDARYVDAQEWARLNGISREEAQQELERAARAGLLKQMFLYEGEDSPITFVVPESRLGTPVHLSETGYFGEDDDRELMVSKHRSRPVYVAARGLAHRRAHVG